MTLQGRTLYKDGSWNTLCLPFQVTLKGSPLDGATVMELDATGTHDTNKHTGFDASTSTLYLYFTPVTTTIEANKPYIIKWAGGDNIVNPVFTGVTVVGNASERCVTAKNTGLNTVDFIGTYAPASIAKDDKSCLFLGAGNTLYYPSANMNINACRAYFHVDLTGSVNVRAFVLNLDDTSEQTNISAQPMFNAQYPMVNDNWHTLDGRRLNGKPSRAGVYIYNGRKAVIK